MSRGTVIATVDPGGLAEAIAAIADEESADSLRAAVAASANTDSFRVWWGTTTDGAALMHVYARAGDRKGMARAACACAHAALASLATDDARLHTALRVTEAWCDGRATDEEVRAAAAVAQDAYARVEGGAYFCAAWSADAAARTALDAADPDEAAQAAAEAIAWVAVGGAKGAEYVAAHARERPAARRRIADLVRQSLPVPVLRAL